MVWKNRTVSNDIYDHQYKVTVPKTLIFETHVNNWLRRYDITGWSWYIPTENNSKIVILEFACQELATEFKLRFL